MNNKILFFLLCFFLFFAWGVYSTGWYESGQLQIEGRAERGRADLAVLWDSGAGLNKYESRHVSIEVPALAGTEDGMQHVLIRALETKHPNSKSVNVSIIKVIADGEEFDLTRVRSRSIFSDRLAFHLTPAQPVLEFYAEAKEHIQVVFANGNYFGRVAVEINGVPSTHDLFTYGDNYNEYPYDFFLLQPDGAFKAVVDLPRYRIKRLYLQNRNEADPISFSTVSLCRDSSCTALTPAGQEEGGELFFSRPNESLKRFYDPVRIWFKAAFALLNAWLLCQLIAAIRRSGGVVSFFLDRERRCFFGFALLFASVNGFFLAVFWPGIMSPDSLSIWRASGLPEIYQNNHPILNQIFYMYLRGLWNNPAVVPVFQIFAAALLVAFVFGRIRKRGVPLWLLLPFFLPVLFSLPVHLYNIALWKDIPFALLVTAWGVMLAFMYSDRDVGGRPISAGQWFCILAMYIMVGFFRHNGLIYLAVIPVFALVLAPFSWKKRAVFSLSALLVAVGLFWSMSQIRIFGGHDFLSTSITGHARFLTNSSVQKEVVRVGGGYFEVFDMAREGAVSDKWHYYLGDRYSWPYLIKSGLSDFYPYVDPKPPFPELRQTILNLYTASYEKPWYSLIWNPLHMLLLVPLVLIGFRYFPATAIFSGFLLCGVIPLLVINIFNWRYYYFFYFGLFFILPLMLLDLRKGRGGRY